METLMYILMTVTALYSIGAMFYGIWERIELYYIFVFGFVGIGMSFLVLLLMSWGI